MILIAACWLVANLWTSPGPERDISLQAEFARADSMVATGNHDGAISLCRTLLAKCEQTYGPHDTTLAVCLNRIGIYQYQSGAYDSAEASWFRSLGISEQALGPNHPNVAATSNNLGIVARDRGRFSEAEPRFKRAMTVWKQTLGPNHPNVATAANNLGYCYRSLGRYHDALRQYDQALSGWTAAYGPVNADVARAMINIAEVHQDLGQFAEAELYLRKALATLQKVYPDGHPDLAYCLNHLALLCWNQTRLNEADSLYRRALAIYETTLGPDHPYLSYPLDGLAGIDWENGEFGAAEARLRRALEIRRKALGPDNPEVAQLESNLAAMYLDWGRADLALALETHALAVRAAILGENHPDVARSLLSLAGAYARLDIGDSAFAAARRALRIHRNHFGNEHDAVADALEQIALLHLRRGEADSALIDAVAACAIRYSSFLKNGASLSERDALLYTRKFKAAFNLVLTCYFDPRRASATIAAKVADLVLQTKGLVSDVIIERRRQGLSGVDSTARELQTRLQQTKYLITQCYIQGPQEDREHFQRRLDSLESLAAGYDSELARLTGRPLARRESRALNWRTVVAALPSNSALVEYFLFERFDPPDGPRERRYVALILHPLKEPILCELGRKPAIDSLVTNVRAHLARVAAQATWADSEVETEFRRLAGGLKRAVFSPLEGSLIDSRRIVVAGDGDLNFVSFAALPDNGSAYLVERYLFHYVTAGRDLLRLDRSQVRDGIFLAVGDPDFNARFEPRDIALSDKKTPIARDPQACADFLDLFASPLPGTRREVLRVAGAWRTAGNAESMVLVGHEAQEANLRAMAGSTSLLHLATHGYFLADTCTGPQDRASGDKRSLEQLSRSYVRTGLLLAGANNREIASPDNDGVLTAYEIADLDLARAGLVVLSACESGMGDIRSGEGVFGLRRAFVLAGAGTVISTLWPVDDERSADVMTSLYEAPDRPPSERLRDLMLTQLRQLRADNHATHPYLWAAYIAIGAWH